MRPQFSKSTLMAGWCVCENGKPLPTFRPEIYTSRNQARKASRDYNCDGSIKTVVEKIKIQKDQYGTGS